MKKMIFFVLGIVSVISPFRAFAAEGRDLVSEIPSLQPVRCVDMQKIRNVAQYKLADWNNVVGIAKSITRFEAQQIALNDPEITYFFYTKGTQMVLETESGDYRVFNHGDTVFFKGEPWWGSATGLADGYVKRQY